MLLNELFKAKTDLKVLKSSPIRFGTSAMIKGREIRFYAVEEESELDRWEVSFGEIVPGKSYATAEMTGSGGELDVLSMVKDSLTMFIQQRNPKVITFTAEKSDRSRAAVYERMLKRMLPAPWKFEKHDEDFSIRFVLTKT